MKSARSTLQSTLTLLEVARAVGLKEDTLIEWIEKEWLVPAHGQGTASTAELRKIAQLDQEDLARARLIQHLRSDFEVNDEAVSIILHLLDQLHCLHFRITRQSNSPEDSRE